MLKIWFMDKIKEFLAEWTISFLRNKDIIAKKIESIEQNKEGFDLKVVYKDKTQFFLAIMKIVDMSRILESFKDENGHYGIVTFNMQENVDAMINNWDKLCKFRFLSVYFINPWSDADKKWIIYPYTHNNICERDSLAMGIKSMSEMVEFLTESVVKAKTG